MLGRDADGELDGEKEPRLTALLAGIVAGLGCALKPTYALALLLMELMEAAGPIKKWADPVREERAMGHTMGGCRMGKDPKTSVVDQFHRAHDVPNLFVVDGSNFVTSARNHPTCTISALAFRAADQIIKKSKNGSIKSSSA